MNIRIKIIWFGLAAVFLGCSVDYPKADDGSFSAGTANFNKYVAIGNSLTAGVQSGGLKEAFQDISYPRMIANRLGIADAEFTYNNFPDSGTVGTLVLLGFSTTTGSPVFRTTTASTVPGNSLQATPYENLGVPTAFLYDFLNASGSTNGTSWSQTRLGTTNPLFDPIVRGQTQFQNLRLLNPTFVTFHLGNNDILGYATNGAGLNGNFGAIAGVPPYTPVTTADDVVPLGYNFTAGYAAAMDSLATLGADVALVNIPYVTAIPYFTAVNKDSVTVNLNPPAKAKIYTAETDVRYVTLAASNVLGSLSDAIGDGNSATPYGLHPLDPLSGKYTLTTTEVSSINAIIDGYNAVIAAQATAHGWALVDVNDLFNQIAAVSGPTGSGYNAGGGIRVKTDFITGGLFSYDGVHPTSLGYAILANEVIKSVNEHYGSTITQVSVTDFVNF
jgi:lysophospholipase L1-like esterase